MNSEFKHVFGPVPSRRLGRSLGVDLVPYKTCSYDCVYCQLGRTTKKTVERLEYVPLKAVIAGCARSRGWLQGVYPPFLPETFQPRVSSLGAFAAASSFRRQWWHYTAELCACQSYSMYAKRSCDIIKQKSGGGCNGQL